MSTERDPIFGCELATGRRDRDGYAFHGSTRAHIAAWVAQHGAVPADRELDHLCRRRHCVALHHLELVTRAENEKRKSWRYRARIVWCPRGHRLELYAMVTPEGGRVCRQCNREVASAADPDGSVESTRLQTSDQNPSSVQRTERSRFVRGRGDQGPREGSPPEG